MPKAPFGDLLQFLRRMYPADYAGDCTDGELLKRFVTEREEEAFTALVQRHARMVLGVCQRLLGDQHLAEDSFQATFIILARRAASIGWHRSLGAWLYTVAQRVALRAKAKASAVRNREREAGIMPRAERLDEQTWQELRSIIDEEIGRLPEKYQAPLVLCHLEGKSHDRAARELGCAKTTLERRLSRGRDLLCKQLVRRGVALSAAALATALEEKVMGAPVAALLTKHTVQAAVQILAGKAIAGGCLTARVLALAEEAMVGMASVKGKLVVIMVVMTLAVGGAGLAGYAGLGEKTQPSQVAKAPAAKEAGEPTKQEARVTDQYGDPLPEGAVARLGAARFRHEGLADVLMFTPDGKTLLGHTNSGLILWDAATGKELHRLHAPERRTLGTPNGMAVSPDGKILAIIERSPPQGPFPLIQSEITLWDMTDGKKLRTHSLPKVTKGPGGIIAHPHRLFFTPDGKALICLAGYRPDDRKAVILDLKSGEVRMSLGDGEPYGFFDAAVSSDGKMLAAATYPKTSVQLWDLTEGKLIRTHMLTSDDPQFKYKSTLHAIALAPNGKLLSIATFDRTLLIDVATGKEVSVEPNVGFNTGLAFTPDSKKLVSAGLGQLVVSDVASGKALASWKYEHVSGLIRADSMVLAPDGATVALSSNGNVVHIRDIATGKELSPENHGHETPISSLAFSADAKTLASTDETHQTLLWDTARSQPVASIPGGTRALSFSPDGKALILSAINRNESATRLSFWDVAEAKQSLAIAVPGTQVILDAVFAPDGRKLFTLDWNKDRQNEYSVRHWDVASGKEDHEWALPHREAPATKKGFRPKQVRPGAIPQPNLPLALAPDGRTVFAASGMKAFSVYDVESGRQRIIPGPQNDIGWDLSLSVSPDARVVASWIAKPAPAGIVIGGRLAKSEPIATIQVSEVVTGKELFVLKGHQGTVVKVAWSRDGRLVASGERRAAPEEFSETQTVRVWDTATGRELASFGGFKADVAALSFAPDGKSLGAGLRDGSILIWDVSKVDPRSGQAAKPGKSELEACWALLGASGAGQAHQAIGTLVGAPKETVPFLRDKLQPARVTDAAKIRQWILDQDSQVFAVRQSAAKELEKAGAQARTPILNATREKASLEARLRLEQILNVLDVPSAETVRTIRAVMVLERIGSGEAQEVLDALAHGAPGALETEEARASLERLDPQGRGGEYARAKRQSMNVTVKAPMPPAKLEAPVQVKELPSDNGPAAEALREATNLLETATGNRATLTRLWCAVADLRRKLGDMAGAARALDEAKKIANKPYANLEEYRSIGEAYGRLGNSKAVLDLAAAAPKIQGELGRQTILTEGADEAVRAGHLRQADEIAGAIIDPQEQKRVKVGIGRAALVQRAKAGDVAGAIKGAEELPTAEEKAVALVGFCSPYLGYDDDRGQFVSRFSSDGLAWVLLGAGNKSEAKKIALQALALVPGVERSRGDAAICAALQVVRILARMDELPSARKALAEVLTLDEKAAAKQKQSMAVLKAKGYIGAAAARAGRDDAALAAAEECKEPSERAYILQEVALVQARAGRKELAKANFKKAFELVTKRGEGEITGTNLHNIASAQALASDFAGAFTTMEQMDPTAIVWANVVQGQLEVGDFAGAKTLTQAHEKDSYRHKRICTTIATFQAKAGQFEAVREWADKETNQLVKIHLLVGLAEGLYREGAKVPGR